MSQQANESNEREKLSKLMEVVEIEDRSFLPVCFRELETRPKEPNKQTERTDNPK